MGKIWLTISLVLFFILGFTFKQFFDFKIFEKSTRQENNKNIAETQTAQISGSISNSISNLPAQDAILTISDVIHAKEQEKIFDNSAYITPDQNPNFLPIRDWTVPFIEINAKSAITTDQNASRIFYQKNITEKLPIASLTKLMTAIVVAENIHLNNTAKISKQAIDQEGVAGKLIVDEEITLENLLKALLIESSNDAAFALEEYSLSQNINLIDLMNQKAQALNLIGTHFSSSSGLSDKDNYSTAYDYAKLISYSLNNDTIWKMLKISSTEISSVNNSQVRRLINSNQLLGKISGMMGGKTGYTQEAGGCLLTVTKINDDMKIISVVLGSENRFGETEKLINWIKRAYRF